MSALDTGRNWLRHFRDRPRVRWTIYAVLAAVLAVLCIFPQPYLARAKILPQDASSTGLNAVLNSIGGQQGVFAALLNNRQAIDVYLIIGRSEDVRGDVATALQMYGPDRPFSTRRDALVYLEKKVAVHSLTGGVIEIEATTHDAEEARRMTQAYVEAISSRIRTLGREQLATKKLVVRERFGEAIQRLSDAENRLAEFRRRNQLSASPEAELTAAIAARAGVEAQLNAKRVELRTAQRFAGPENYRLRAVQQDIATLEAQLASMERASRRAGGPNTALLTETSAEYIALFRNFAYAQSIFDVYKRFSEQIEVEELSATTTANVQLVEDAHVDPARHYNLMAVGALALLIVLVLFFEIYAPATGLIFRRGAQPQAADGNAGE